jgi:hypothetical protein
MLLKLMEDDTTVAESDLEETESAWGDEAETQRLSRLWARSCAICWGLSSLSGWRVSPGRPGPCWLVA